jgi:cephalosporin hydroxylase
MSNNVEEAEIISRFHRLWYHKGIDDGTWSSIRFLGVPILKNPFDLWRYQEILFELKPELIIECGTYFGGSAYYLARVCDWIDRGHVVSIDIEERSDRPLHPRITYLAGSSTEDAIIMKVGTLARKADSVLVILDSDHSKDHVLDELRSYSGFVTAGSYIIVEDTNINGHPVTENFDGPGPMEAVDAFLIETSQFSIDRSREKLLMTFNPRGFLRRKSFLA